MKVITDRLFAERDEKYAEFQAKMIPTLAPETVIGVRTPILRKLAKEVAKADYCDQFLAELPHKYFDEYQLHGFIISGIKDFDRCIQLLDEFLPYIDNWATCDQTSPKTAFKKNLDKMIDHAYRWMSSEEEYICRFGIGMIMEYYLDEAFDVKYINDVAAVKSDKYYVNMEIAWCLATALAKQWDSTISILEEKRMDKWVHNKTIQKGVESNRITKEQKDHLRSLRIK